jgi:hypothetical protein
MNTDDKIRAILRMEADEVQPSAAGWDAITTGIAARRRRNWWVRGSAFAVAAAAVTALAVVVTTDTSKQALTPATPGPTVSSPAPAPELPVPAPVVDGHEPIGAIWPLTTTGEVAAWQADHATYPSLATPDGSALAFARTYLGIADASVTFVKGRQFTVTRPVNGKAFTVTTLDVAAFGAQNDAPFLVTAAHSDAIAIATPQPDTAVTGPLAAHGTYRVVDPALDVSVRADDGGTAPVILATARATTGPPDVWDATLPFTTTAKTGSLLVTNGSTVDSGLAAAAAVPVVFDAAAAEAMPATFVAVRDQRVAIVSTSTGNVVRYLTAQQPGGGASAPELSEDGTTVLFTQGGGTCSSYVQSVPVAGGTPATVISAQPETVVGPASRRGGVLAYGRVHCNVGAPNAAEVVVMANGTEHTFPIDGDLDTGPVVGPRLTAYVTRKNTATTLYVADPATGTSQSVDAPAGCEWTAATWSTRLVAAAACGSDTRLYAVDADRGTNTLLGHAASLPIRTLDYSTGGAHLILGVFTTNYDYVAYTWEGGVPRRVPGFAESPSWQAGA